MVDLTLTKEQQQILMGSAIGDGHIIQYKTQDYAMAISHESKQKSWVEHKAKICSPIINQNGIKFDSRMTHDKRRIKSKLSENYSFQTTPHVFITEIHHQLYTYDDEGNPQKTLLNLFPKLNKIGIATVLGDDGSTVFLENDPNQFHYCRFYLSGFPVEEVAFAADYLSTEYGIDCVQLIQDHKKHSYPYDRKYPYISIRKKGFYILQDLLKDHLPDEMLYKIGLRLDLKPKSNVGRKKGGRNHSA